MDIRGLSSQNWAGGKVFTASFFAVYIHAYIQLEVYLYIDSAGVVL